MFLTSVLVLSRGKLDTPTFDQSSTAAVGNAGIVHSKKIFAHVHIAKTAGSSLNRALARRYLGVCGHKGYSFTMPFADIKDRRTDPKHRKFGRDRVHPSRMADWGFFNCALISHEIGSTHWKGILAYFANVTRSALIPCRDPVDHFMSMATTRIFHLRKYFETQLVLQGSSVCLALTDLIHECWTTSTKLSYSSTMKQGQFSTYWMNTYHPGCLI